MSRFPCRCCITSLGGLGITDERTAVLQTAAEQSEDVQAAMAHQGTDMAAEGKRMEEAIKDRAIKNAIISAGAQLAIMAIPGVGQALSSVVGGFLGVSNEKYAKKTEEMIKGKQEWLVNHIAKKKQALDDAISASYRVAYSKATPLALSFQTLEVGPDEGVFDQSFDGIGDIVERMSGHDTYTKARDKMSALVEKAAADVDAQIDPIIKKVKQEGFRSLLAKQIAIEMRREPGFLDLARSKGVPPPSKYLDEAALAQIAAAANVPVSQVASKGSMTPLLIGGAALAAVLLLR